MVASGLCSRWSPFAELHYLKTVDFRQYIFRLGLHFKVCQFTVFMVHNAHFIIVHYELVSSF